MARLYHIDIAIHAANCDRKWADNLLSRFAIPGVENARQGIARRLSVDGICQVALVRELTQRLAIPAHVAVDLAITLLGSGGRASLAGGLTLEIDEPEFRRAVEARIAEAVESIVPARRGRPPGTTKKGERP